MENKNIEDKILSTENVRKPILQKANVRGESSKKSRNKSNTCTQILTSETTNSGCQKRLLLKKEAPLLVHDIPGAFDGRKAVVLQPFSPKIDKTHLFPLTINVEKKLQLPVVNNQMQSRIINSKAAQPNTQNTNGNSTIIGQEQSVEQEMPINTMGIPNPETEALLIHMLKKHSPIITLNDRGVKQYRRYAKELGELPDIKVSKTKEVENKEMEILLKKHFQLKREKYLKMINQKIKQISIYKPLELIKNTSLTKRTNQQNSLDLKDYSIESAKEERKISIPPRLTHKELWMCSKIPIIYDKSRIGFRNYGHLRTKMYQRSKTILIKQNTLRLEESNDQDEQSFNDNNSVVQKSFNMEENDDSIRSPRMINRSINKYQLIKAKIKKIEKTLFMSTLKSQELHERMTLSTINNSPKFYNNALAK